MFKTHADIAPNFVVYRNPKLAKTLLTTTSTEYTTLNNASKYASNFSCNRTTYLYTRGLHLFVIIMGWKNKLNNA